MGRVIMVHGPFSSGKTTIAIKLAASVQKKKKQNTVCWVDAEGTFDKDWAAQLGCDLTKLVILQPDEGQKGLDIADEVVRTGECGLLVLDSIATIVPKEELEASMEEWQMGLQARMINKFIRKVTSALQPKDLDGAKNDCIVLLLNQERVTMDKYKPISTPGGMGKDFASSIVIQLRRGAWILDEKRVVGHEIYFKVEKNKTFPPKREGVFDFYNDDFTEFKKGDIDNDKAVILYAIQQNIIERSGSYYIYGQHKFQGQDKLLQFLKSDLGVYAEIKERVLKMYSVDKSLSTEPVKKPKVKEIEAAVEQEEVKEKKYRIKLKKK